ncbi:MAG: sodium:calcium antiporter [Candidatus Aenigmarchaeota archaeon]|nr:sodium:calcium antiporter [Candidatus Aenigmarchaeota archaeon]
MIALFLLMLSLLVLVKFSNVTVDSAARLSKVSGISPTIIGFIFIGISTSLPELAIALASSLQGEGQLSLGNLIGANIYNLTLILGLMSFVGFSTTKILSSQMKYAAFMTTLIAAFLIYTRISGFVFGLFLLALFYMFAASIKKVSIPYRKKSENVSKNILKLIFAVSAVVISARVATDSSVLVAASLGLSEAMIGASLLALGTTLPEMSVNIAAVRKRNIALAVGDTVGTIMANLALVAGVASMINPITITSDITGLLIMLMSANAIFFYLARKMQFGFRQGSLLLSAFAIYLLVVFVV